MLDLSRVTFLDSSGLCVLIEVAAASDVHGTLHLVGVFGNDPFAGTDLQSRLKEIAPDRVLIAGWATDFCVDATVRSAVANHHNVVVVADGHTLSDRPHLDAISIIRHHNWVWSNLITQKSIKLAGANELLL